MNHYARLITGLALAGLAGGACAAAPTQANPGSCVTANAGPDHDGVRDYDFISGRTWTVRGRKRVGRFVGSTQWEEMDGVEKSRRIGDAGMMEEIVFPKWRPDYKLTILRLYDPLSRRWSIYDMHDANNTSPPLQGTFHHGLGIFVGDDEINNKPVKVRYIWTCDWVHPRFQQEFSNDAGKTWEIDWQMEFTEKK